jgi:hypothetical protein
MALSKPSGKGPGNIDVAKARIKEAAGADRQLEMKCH